MYQSIQENKVMHFIAGFHGVLQQSHCFELSAIKLHQEIMISISSSLDLAASDENVFSLLYHFVAPVLILNGRALHSGPHILNIYVG